jgi:hypothetical protein
MVKQKRLDKLLAHMIQMLREGKGQEEIKDYMQEEKVTPEELGSLTLSLQKSLGFK